MQWGDLITLEYGKPIKDKESVDGPIPVYGTNGQIGTSHLKPLCEHPSFILGRKGAYRGVHYSDTPFSVIDTAFYAQSISDKVDLKWAYYKFLTYDINRMDSGSAIPSTDRYEIYSINVDLPDLATQRKVVSVLELLDNKIQDNNKINDNLEATLNAVYKEFFTVASPDELPYGWKIAPFSEIASITMGQSPEGDDCNTSGFGKALLNGPTEFGFYSPSPVQWTTTVKKHCVEGDLLFCVRGSTTGRMNWANQSYAIGRGLAAIHHKTTPNLNWFIKAMIDNNLQEILAAATGSTFPNVGKDLLNGFKVIIPDDTTLQKFGSKGYAISRLITANAKEIDTLLVFQKTLLSKLTI